MSSQQPAPNYDNYTRNYNNRPEQQYSNPLLQQTVTIPSSVSKSEPSSSSSSSLQRASDNTLIKSNKPPLMSSLLSQITEGAGKLKPRNKNKVTTTPVIQQISDNPLIASINQPSQQTVSAQSPYYSLRGVNELLASLPSVPNRDYDSLSNVNEYMATLPPVPKSKKTQITKILEQYPIDGIKSYSQQQLLIVPSSVATTPQPPPPLPPQKITKEEKAILQQTASVPIPNVVIPSLQP